MMSQAHRWLGLGLAAAMGGCAGQSAAIPPRVSVPFATRDLARSNALYVINATLSAITVYDSDSRTPNRTLQLSNLAAPSAIAFDRAGSAYIANRGGGGDGNGSISVYRNGQTTPYRTIRRGIGWPQALAFDAHWNLNVANDHVKLDGGHLGSGSITTYPPGKAKPADTIRWSEGICSPWSVAFDQFGNRYVANHWNCSDYGNGSVSVFSPSSDGPSRTITNGIRQPRQLLLDKTGTLYVANGLGGISVYPPGASKPRTIIDPTHTVFAIAMDDDGGLYELSRWVLFYPRGKSRATQKIKLNDSISMTLDAHGNLYVGSNPKDCGTIGKTKKYGCVLVFEHRTLKQQYLIPIAGAPSVLTFGPP